MQLNKKVYFRQLFHIKLVQKYVLKRDFGNNI